MGRSVLLLASVALAVLFASGTVLAQETDTTPPIITWTERPGTQVSSGLWVTKADRLVKLAWAVSDENPDENGAVCDLFYTPSGTHLQHMDPCWSPSTYGSDGGAPHMADGVYRFTISASDAFGNIASTHTDFEIDRSAPLFLSGKPTRNRVAPGADVVATFDDAVYDSDNFVNIYRQGSSTPLAVSRQTTDNRIVLDPKNNLKADTRYAVKVTTGVSDGANNLEAPKTWSFKTK